MPECTCKQGDLDSFERCPTHDNAAGYGLVNMNETKYIPSTETPRYMYIGDGIVLVEGPLEKVKDHLDEIKKVLRESFEKEMEERSKRKK